MDPVISRLGDAGRPAVTAEEAQASAQAFRGIARALAARVSVMQFGDNHG